MEVSQDQTLDGGDGDVAPNQLTPYFYKVLPFYLSIGMSWDQYWDGDCMMAKYYREAHELKKHRQNEMLWLQGAYVYEAVADLVPVLHAFAKSSAKPVPYMSEPFALDAKDMQAKAKRKEEIEYDKKKAKVAAWAAAANLKFARKEMNIDA